MLDFMGFYNIKDTEILSDAFSNLCKSFYADSRVNPLDFMSLPAMSESIMWSMYDNRINFRIRSPKVTSILMI